MFIFEIIKIFISIIIFFIKIWMLNPIFLMSIFKFNKYFNLYSSLKLILIKIRKDINQFMNKQKIAHLLLFVYHVSMHFRIIC